MITFINNNLGSKPAIDELIRDIDDINAALNTLFLDENGVLSDHYNSDLIEPDDTNTRLEILANMTNPDFMVKLIKEHTGIDINNYESEDELLAAVNEKTGLNLDHDGALALVERLASETLQNELAQAGLAERTAKTSEIIESSENILNSMETTPQEQRILELAMDDPRYAENPQGVINELLQPFRKSMSQDEFAKTFPSRDILTDIIALKTKLATAVENIPRAQNTLQQAKDNLHNHVMGIAPDPADHDNTAVAGAAIYESMDADDNKLSTLILETDENGNTYVNLNGSVNNLNPEQIDQLINYLEHYAVSQSEGAGGGGTAISPGGNTTIVGTYNLSPLQIAQLMEDIGAVQQGTADMVAKDFPGSEPLAYNTPEETQNTAGAEITTAPSIPLSP